MVSRSDSEGKRRARMESVMDFQTANVRKSSMTPEVAPAGAKAKAKSTAKTGLASSGRAVTAPESTVIGSRKAKSRKSGSSNSPSGPFLPGEETGYLIRN
jgi:hypothetical protein